MNKLHADIKRYILQVIEDAFKTIEKPNDAKVVIVVIGEQGKDLCCLLFMKSIAHLKVYNRVNYRLSRNFKKNFGLDIKFFPAIKEYSQMIQGFVETDRNSGYGCNVYHSSDDNKPVIDPNHCLFYLETKTLGDFSISIFPWDIEAPFGAAKFAGWHPDIAETRILYKDIIAAKGVENIQYHGRDGWKQYCEDYALVCDGDTPGSRAHCAILYDDKMSK